MRRRATLVGRRARIVPLFWRKGYPREVVRRPPLFFVRCCRRRRPHHFLLFSFFLSAISRLFFRGPAVLGSPSFFLFEKKKRGPLVCSWSRRVCPPSPYERKKDQLAMDFGLPSPRIMAPRLYALPWTDDEPNNNDNHHSGQSLDRRPHWDDRVLYRRHGHENVNNH
ncbi:cathepsin C1-like peptidase [Pandoravirus inopinatum]|uniref:Cathepsin C1-like peptidase n=1 Tax=Pandoravirus inopinatum TaxID=1605721 RepID=A0A0B5J8X4_9VIRU|nr:cathepsin C1-like peptidase [Pandoravirus inopinatum]AJF97241.1 cathepsin C1-like peptidase [Pandoravirus inopinatum]